RPPMREEGLRAVPEHIRAIIDGTQPYLGGDRAGEHVFAVLSRLDNADKHRVVQSALAVVKDPGTIDTSEIRRGDERTLHTEWLAVGEALRMNKKTDVLRWRTEPPSDRV